MRNMPALLVIALLLAQTSGFSTSSTRIATRPWEIARDITLATGRSKSYSSKAIVLRVGTYGRGAEIWPECNEDAIQLADSFPNGEVPPSAILAMEQADMEAVHLRVRDAVQGGIDVGDPMMTTTTTTTSTVKKSKRKMVSRGIRRILRRAAAKEELEFEEQAPTTRISKTPYVVAIGLLVRGLVRPLDVVVISLLTAYFVILELAAKSPRDSSTGAPTLPALPPQGHVPTIVSDPMGLSFTYSKQYDLWLKLGVMTGLFGPMVLLSRYTLQKDMVAARMCARPILLLCCQAISEAFSRRIMAPLPIRILIPVAYNTVRLGYLWSWLLHTSATGSHYFWGRALAGANLAYWAINLFAFLLPVASLRYMRAHFFAVEAESVTTRRGMEETIGLIPHGDLLS